MEVNELDNDEIQFGHGATLDTSEEDVAKEETVTDEQEDNNEDAVEEKAKAEDEPTESSPKKDSKQQALDFERSKRKQLEKELKELKAERERQVKAKEEEETLSKERENLKAKMLEGDLIDEDVAEKLVNTIGDDIIKMKIASKKLAEDESFEKAFAELKQDDMYMDADKYKDKIREFVKKGLTVEEAYGASMLGNRGAQLKKDLEIEIEQRLLNSDLKADKIDIGHAEAKGEAKRTSYTREEQMIARETGLDVKEVHKRANMHSLDEFLNL